MVTTTALTCTTSYWFCRAFYCILGAEQVNSTFNRYSRVQNLRGLTGAQAAEAVLRYNGVSGVRIGMFPAS